MQWLGQPGYEYDLVFECQALQGVRDKYPDLSGEHAVTMVKFMLQTDLHGIANFITDCLEVYANAGPIEGQTSDQR